MPKSQEEILSSSLAGGLSILEGSLSVCSTHVKFLLDSVQDLIDQGLSGTSERDISAASSLLNLRMRLSTCQGLIESCSLTLVSTRDDLSSRSDEH